MKGRITGAIALVLAVSAIAGCAVQPKQVAVYSNFDEVQARELIQPGANIVSGSALIRQNGGGVVTCAGLEVMLIPRTAYAEERFSTLYGNTQRGYNPVFRTIDFVPNPPEYLQLTKRTLCDAQGNFAFNDVADGEFFLASMITWNVGNAPQGGAIMQAISVAGGQSVQVVLSP
jgi:hypothetical protein